MIVDAVILILGEPARRGRRFQASQKPHSRTNVGKRCPPAAPSGYPLQCFLPSVPYVRMIIRTYNPLSNNIYNRRQAKNISTSIPLAIPAVPNVYNTFLLPPPERFPMSGFAPEGAEWENGAHSPTELLSLPGHYPTHSTFIIHHSSFIIHHSAFSIHNLLSGSPRPVPRTPATR